jgi:hypothetical protein
LRPVSAPVSSTRPRLARASGPIPVGDGFIVNQTEATALRRDPANLSIVRPNLVGEDIANESSQSASRWIVDFGLRTLDD